MAKKGSFGFFKFFFDFRAWMGWDSIYNSGKNIKAMTKDLTSTYRNGSKETFEEAINRFNLTDEDVEKKKKYFLKASLFYLAVSVLLFSYSLYLFFSNSIQGGILSSMLVLLCLSFAFREHFWYTQVRYRRLGFTLGEWFRVTLGKRN